MPPAANPAAPSVLRPPITGRGVHLQMRYVRDLAAKWTVGIGGITVLVALLLIFIYLLSEVAPLFRGAELEPRSEFAVPGDAAPTLYLTAEEQAEVGMRVSAAGAVTFFDLASGAVRQQASLPVPAGVTVTQVVEVAAEQGYVAVGLSDGTVLPLRHTYRVTYPNDRRTIEPALEFPRGPRPLPFMAEVPRALVVRDDGDALFFAAADGHGRVHLGGLTVTTSLLGETSVAPATAIDFLPPVKPDLLLVNPLLDWLYVIERGSGRIAFFRLHAGAAPELVATEPVGAAVSHATFLAGGISVLTADVRGIVTQWFPARRADGSSWLASVRRFELPEGTTITALGAELRRRSFAVGDAEGNVRLFYATSEREVLDERLFDGPIEHLAFEPRAHALLAQGRDGRLRTYSIENEHPEVSWSALWGKVWYESYDQPEVLWQSSSASADFEPKFSLTPLTVGTIKGAFYAMIFAVPLAVLGAIFTANFMSPALRQVVKPTVEIMQALPTVILGFLAGLWLAPFVEIYLPGVFLTLLLLPLSIPLFGYLWTRMPTRVRLKVPEGWEAVLLLPVIGVVVWFCFALAQPVEAWLFAGNMQAWMDREFGIGYEQRNSLVVGIAMGVAVIPSIFSIAEDAVFSVPKQLSLGSLALGATQWQTLVGVVLPTASPGIFSAIMIGMGRAVGETMIVLMATGNTPVMDFSIFSGMRTLSANVAVEMPESEVGSTHFRLLFLAGVVLFVLTFFFNTLAEVVRQNLRKKYGNI